MIIFFENYVKLTFQKKEGGLLLPFLVSDGGGERKASHVPPSGFSFFLQPLLTWLNLHEKRGWNGKEEEGGKEETALEKCRIFFFLVLFPPTA